MYRIRIPIGIAMILVMAAVFHADHRWATDGGTTIALTLLISVALGELYALFGLSPSARRMAVAVGVLLQAALYLRLSAPGWLTFDPVEAAAAACAVLLLVPWLLAPDESEHPTEARPALPPGNLTRASIVVFGYVYVVFLLSYLIRIRFLRVPGSGGGQLDGILLLFFVVISAKGGDMGGYLIGKAFGRHRILPRISPKKSVEGTLAGLALSAGLAIAMASLFEPVGALMSLPVAAGFGVVASALSLAGDLVESSIKRRTGFKDSGQLIPEFGGILDLMDSLVFAAPVGYYFLHFLVERA